MVAPSWAPIRRRASSIGICRAGMSPTCSCWARARFRRTRVTTRPARWPRWRSGPRTPYATGTSKTRDGSSMRSVGSLARSFGTTGAGVAILLASSPVFAGASDPQEFTQIERGRYLAVAADCASCHTLPGSNTPFAGGRAIETPFGNIVAPNITPDRETGIGAWSDAEFDAAVRKGVRRGGSPLYPAMPYNAYTKMSSDDVQAIHAYLSTVTPVRNPVVAKSLPFPFNIRSAMHVWNALYFNEGEYKSDPKQTAEWNRGAFLVDG